MSRQHQDTHLDRCESHDPYVGMAFSGAVRDKILHLGFYYSTAIITVCENHISNRIVTYCLVTTSLIVESVINTLLIWNTTGKTCGINRMDILSKLKMKHQAECLV